MGVWRFVGNREVTIEDKDKLIVCTEHIDSNIDMLCDACSLKLPLRDYATNKSVEAEVSSGESKVQISGIMPKESKANIVKINKGKAITLAKKYKSDITEENIINAYDISLVNNDFEYQPNEHGQSVNVKLSNLELDTSKRYALLHIIGDSNFEILPAKILNSSEIEFEATSFSTYILISVGSNTITFDGENFKVFDTEGNEITDGAHISSGTSFNFNIVPNNGWGTTDVTCVLTSGDSAISVVGEIKGKTCHIANVTEDLMVNVTTAIAPSITTQPVTVKAKRDGTANFIIVAENATTYEWQYRVDKNSLWTSASSLASNTSATFKPTANLTIKGYEFRCIVGNANFTNHERVISDIVAISVAEDDITKQAKIVNLAITAQPEIQKVKLGDTATYTITATGAGTYTWQYSPSGEDFWYNCSGVTGMTVSSNKLQINTSSMSVDENLNLVDSLSGMKIRCVVSSASVSGYTKTSDVAMLSVGQDDVGIESISIVDILHPEDTTVAEGGEATFTAGLEPSADGSQYEWHEVIDGNDVNLAEQSIVYKSNIEGKANTTCTERIIINSTGTTAVNFEYMVSSEQTNDTFTVTIEDANGITTAVNGISGNVAWQSYTGSFTPNAQNQIILNLTYSKNGSVDGGKDYGAIRNLKCSYIKGIDAECEYVDDENNVFKITNPDTSKYSAAKPWSIVTVDGVLTFQSSNAGVSSSYSMAKIDMYIPKEGTLSFEYRASSESVSYDYFQANLTDANNSDLQLFKIGGTTGSTIDWTPYTGTVTPDATGKVTLILLYRKDDSVNKGDDLGAIRNLQVTAQKNVEAKCGYVSDEVFEVENKFEQHGYLGANTSTLVIPGALTTLDKNGAKYYCNIGGITTNTATLNVIKNTVVEFQVVISGDNFVYNGSEVKPVIVVKYEDNVIAEEFYDITYSNNMNAGTATVTVNGKGDYLGSLGSATFVIGKRNLEITVGNASKEYDGTELTCSEYKITSGELAAGDTLSATTKGSIVDVGTTTNTIETMDIFRGETKVTTNYNINIKEGTLEILQSTMSGSVLIKGINRVGQTLKAELTIGVVAYNCTYKWYTNENNSMTGGTPITGATSDSLLITDDMLDKYIYVEVTVTVDNYKDTVIKDITDSTNNSFSKVFEGYASILKTEVYEDVYTDKYIFGNSNISQRRSDIERIIIQNNMTAPTGETISLDISKEQNESVTAWIVQNGGAYDLYIGGTGSIVVSDGKTLFANYPNCTSITGLEYLNTYEVTDMSYMFADNSSLTNLAIEDIQVNFAGDMSYMFKDCSKLTSLDLSNFETDRATNMKGMFSGCSKLTSLDVSNLYTIHVTDMSGMFENCSELETIDVSKFYTNNVTNMASMFAGCSKVSSLNLLTFNTSKVKSVGKMFKGCAALVNLDLSRFDLRSLDGSTYYKEVEGTKDIGQTEMFNGCTNLYTMVLGKYFARIDGANMFTGCNKLVSIIAQSPSAMTLGATTGLNTLTDTILYVPKASAEVSYENASNYSNVFGTDRVKPMLEVLGNNPEYVGLLAEYEDAGVKIAGFDKANENEYKKYGYSLIVENADVDTSTIGTKKVIYKLNYFDTMIDIFEQ